MRYRRNVADHPSCLGNSVKISLGALLATTALTSPILAAPDNCTASGTTFVCEGNQSEGVDVGSDSGTSIAAKVVTIENLTPLSNNAPYTGPFQWVSDGEDDIFAVEFSLDMGEIPHQVAGSQNSNVAIITDAAASDELNGPVIEAAIESGTFSGSAETRIALVTFGRAGAKGPDGSKHSQAGKVGQTGGSGGIIELTTSASGKTTTYKGGILRAESAGAAGGLGGGGYNGGQYSQPGGNGGEGGDGGPVYLLAQGTTTLMGNAQIQLTSNGGYGGEGGTVGGITAVGSSTGGNGGTGGKGGGIYFDTSRNSDASTGSWVIDSSADIAIDIQTTGGTGGRGGYRGGDGGGHGGNGGAGGDVIFGNTDRSITSSGHTAVRVVGTGGVGGNTSKGDSRAPAGIGGTGGKGSTIVVDGTWTINGTGTNTSGLVLESVGGTAPESGDFGEGGDGGAIYLTNGGASTITTSGPGIAIGSIGGNGDLALPNGGDAGNGGPVTLGISRNGDVAAGSWRIQTNQDKSPGMVVLSQGGAGGVSRSGGSGWTIEVAEGSPAFDVSTSGDNSPAIGFFSIGGSGGVSGIVSDRSGDGGNGGNMYLHSDVQISTTGSNSHGLEILTQGGEAGVPADGGQLGIPGTGGYVELVVSGGGIKTSGSSSDGIRVRTVAGQTGIGSIGTGDLEIDVLSNVSAIGKGSTGVWATSQAYDLGKAGTVSVGVQPGAEVTGNAAAVFLDSGSLKSVYNYGTIASTSGTGGTAIQFAGSGKTFIENNGTITGNVVGANPLETGSATLVNRSGGTVRAGRRIDAEVRNRGLFLATGRGSGTQVSGDFKQGAKGTLLTPLKLEGSVLVTVAGAAEIAGDVGLMLADPGALFALDGDRGSFPVLTAEDGVALDLGAAAPSSAVARYALALPDDTDLHIGYDIDFANGDILVASNDNQDQVAHHLQDLWTSGVLSDEAPNAALALLAAETAADYAEIADSLSAEIYANTQLTTLLAAQQFGDRLMSCAEGTEAERFVAEGQCAWLRIAGERFNQDDNDTSAGFNQNAFVIEGGAQYEIAPDTHLGLALGFSESTLNMDHASADGEQYWLGLAAKHQIGRALFAASLSAGTGTFDITRDPQVSDRATGSQDLWSLSGQLRSEYTFVQRDWYFKPRFDLELDRVETKSVRESGADAFDLDVASAGETYVSLQPQVEFGGDIALEGGTVIRPMLALGLTHFLTNGAPEVSAGLAASGSDEGFSSEAQLDRTWFDLSAGIEVFARDRLSLRADAFTSLSENSQIYGGGFRVEYAF